MKLLKLKMILLSLFVISMLSSLVAAQTPYDTAGWGFLAGACLIWVIIWFIIWILVAIWVYRDAEKRGKSGALWLIIVIILGLIGLIIWLVVRGGTGAGKPSGRRCPNCGREIPEDALTCPYCGKKFNEFPK